MAKDTFYFSHDYNSRADEKIKLLIRKHGILGYGTFWAIIEDLYNNANALRTDYEGIAFDLRTDKNKVESIINDFDLFIVENGSFSSKSVERRLNERYEKSNKAKQSAQSRWKNQPSNANGMRTECERINISCEGNAIKESKVKESKVKENKEEENIRSEKKVPNELTQFEKFNLWLKKEAPNVLKIKNQITEAQFDKLKQTYNSKQIMDIVLNLDNFKDAPKKYTNVNRTVTNWLQRENNKTK